MRQGTVSTTDTALKDSRSEPDCTRPLLAPPAVKNESSPSPTAAEVPPARKYMLSRSQVLSHHSGRKFNLESTERKFCYVIRHRSNPRNSCTTLE